MHGEDRIDQVAVKGPQPHEGAIFVRARKPRTTDYVGHQDRSEFPGLAHGVSAEARSPIAARLGMAAAPCCAQEDVEAGSAALRVDRPVYPRRVELITHVEGGIDNKRPINNDKENC
jgi:hypothetical protein